jgi:hypothetical protein
MIIFFRSADPRTPQTVVVYIGRKFAKEAVGESD